MLARMRTRSRAGARRATPAAIPREVLSGHIGRTRAMYGKHAAVCSLLGVSGLVLSVAWSSASDKVGWTHPGARGRLPGRAAHAAKARPRGGGQPLCQGTVAVKPWRIPKGRCDDVAAWGDALRCEGERVKREALKGGAEKAIGMAL